jgi:hypothetical protein
MGKIAIFDDSGNAQDVALPSNVSVTVTPPQPISPPPSNAPDVSFTATMTAKGVATIRDTSTNLPTSATGSVNFAPGISSSIRAGNMASYGYKAEASYVVTLRWKATDGTTYSCTGTVVFDGTAHTSSSDPGTTVTPPASTPPGGGNGGGTPPPPPPNPNPPQVPPPVPSTAGAHSVNVSVLDGTGTVWSVVAGVGDDWTVMGPYCALRDASGNVHPGLRARIHSDGCLVGTMAGSATTDYAGELTVTYDGATVFTGAVQFPRGCANKVIRYGKQAPWHGVDPSLFPNWALPTSPLKLPDLIKYDLSYNGLGVASTTGMADPGARWDICFVPGWTVPFCLQPSDASFAVVRASADSAGGWAVYWIDDNTGLPFDITAYPNTSMIGYGKQKYVGNPIAQYGDKPSDKITDTPYKWSQAHQTGYCFVAAAATDSALDKWQAACHANAALIAFNPIYRRETGIWRHYQQRGSAWALRSLFLASYVSCMPDYFAAQLSTMCGLAPFDNPLGYCADYFRPGALDVKGSGGTGVAMFEENYLRTVVNVIANKIPAWAPFRAHLAQATVMMGSSVQFPVSTIYVTTVRDAEKNWLTSWTDVMRATLTGPVGVPAHGMEPPNDKGAWSQSDIDAFTAADVTQDQVYALVAANVPGYVAGNLMQYAAMPDGYPALHGAACAAAMDAGAANAAAAWAIWQAVPTKPDYSQNWGWNIIPKVN